MNKLSERHNAYNSISNTLACISNKQIEQIISSGDAMHTGIGGASLKTTINYTPVFVKKIPLTDLELQPENYMSTANIFNLPMCYQYGIGSAGFGAWRELAAHIMTTNWVITNKCYNFPIMYHWRILKDADNKTILNKELAALDKDTAYWENNQEIHGRLKAKFLATHHIYLFLEFIPNHLCNWLSKQLSSSDGGAIDAVKLVEDQMQETNDFMNSQNFLHMDAHFKNILTDGSQLYYSDFGLSLSDKFQLSREEKEFFGKNITYDKSSGIINLLHYIITAMNKNKLLQKTNVVQDIQEDISSLADDLNQFKKILNHYINGSISSKIKPLDTIIKNYAPTAMKMDEFYHLIQKDKSTQYPSTLFEGLLNSISEIKS
jgi:hypothetical protein